MSSLTTSSASPRSSWLANPAVQWTFGALLGLDAVALVVSRFGRPLGAYDESAQLVSGWLVARGFLPHVDFWSHYPPLNHYLNAAGFALLGESVFTARLLQAGFFLLMLAVLLLHARRELGTLRFLVLPVGLACLIVTGGRFLANYWNAYAIGFCGFLVYLHSWAAPRHEGRGLALLAGVLIAALLPWKLNFAAYFCFGIGADLLRSALPESLGGTAERSEALVRGCLFAAPVVVAGTALLAFVASTGSAGDEALEQIWRFALGPTQAHRRVSFWPDAVNARFLVAAVLPFLWIAIRTAPLRRGASRRLLRLAAASSALGLLFVCVGTFWSESWPDLAWLVAAMILVIGCRNRAIPRVEFTALVSYAFFLHYGFSRVDGVHFSPLLPFIAAMLPAVARDAYAGGREQRLAALQIACLIVILITPVDVTRRGISFSWHRLLPVPADFSAGLALLTSHREGWRHGDASLLQSAPLPLAPALVGVFPDEDEILTVRFVAARTQPEDAVYVGRKDHSATFSGPMSTYWLLGRRIPVKHMTLDSGLSTEDPIQVQMVGDIEAARVEWIILVDNLEGDRDFRRRSYRGSDRLDRHLERSFVEVQAFGAYSIQRRRSDAAEGAGSAAMDSTGR